MDLLRLFGFMVLKFKNNMDEQGSKKHTRRPKVPGPELFRLAACVGAEIGITYLGSKKGSVFCCQVLVTSS